MPVFKGTLISVLLSHDRVVFRVPLNLYLGDFGNVTQRHFWKQNPKKSFLAVMTTHVIMVG